MTRPRAPRTAGLTLIEALIAVAIVAILLAGLVPSFVNALRINTDSEVRSQAVAAAQTVLDSLRAEPDWPPYAGGQPPVRQVDVGGRSYDVTIEYAPYVSDAGDTYDGAREVRLEVAYRDEVRYTVATVYTELR
jgi:type II secretory pathway pseudopilin PulG